MVFERVVPEDARMRAHISQRSNLKYVKTVLDHFDDRQREEFRNSRLGFLADVPEIQFSAQLLQTLVFHQIRTDKRHELWFSLQGKLARFSLQEFAVVTGLQCSSYPTGEEVTQTLSKRRLKDRYFKSVDKISCAQLEACFVRPSTPRADRYKLGLALIVEGIFNAPDNNVGVDQDTLSIVDDPDLFFSYPWGRVGYHRLLKGFRYTWGIKFVHAKNKNEKEVSYTVHGFPIALQIWAYEAIPEIGERFAQKVCDRSPRILRWTSTKQPHRRTYDTFIKSVQLHVSATLRPTEAERNAPYISSIAPHEDRPVPELDDLVINSVAPQFNVNTEVGGQTEGRGLVDGTRGDRSGSRKSGEDASSSTDHGEIPDQHGDGRSGNSDGDSSGGRNSRSDSSGNGGPSSSADTRGYQPGEEAPRFEPSTTPTPRPQATTGVGCSRSEIESMFYDHRALTEMRLRTVKLEIMQHVTEEFSSLRDFILARLPTPGPVPSTGADPFGHEISPPATRQPTPGPSASIGAGQFGHEAGQPDVEVDVEVAGENIDRSPDALIGELHESSDHASPAPDDIPALNAELAAEFEAGKAAAMRHISLMFSVGGASSRGVRLARNMSLLLLSSIVIATAMRTKHRNLRRKERRLLRRVRGSA